MSHHKKFIFSVHDVAPVHLEKLMQAEELIEEYKLSEVCFLLVPNFHDSGNSDKDKVFTSWAQKVRPYSVEWFLHGYYHQERGLEEIAPSANLLERVKKIFLTEREGEFFSLKTEIIRELLTLGTGIYKNLFGQLDPYGFVAPAWLFTPELIPCLKEAGFTVTEDHRFVYNVRDDKKVRCPVVTWATRTVSRKYGSLAVCALLVLLWKKKPVIRIAVHPNDFAHQETVDSIRRILDSEMLERSPVGYRDLVFPD